MAFADCLKLVMPILDRDISRIDTTLINMAVDRQLSLNEDHPIVLQFWALFDYLNSRARVPGDYDDDLVPPIESGKNLLNHSHHPETEIVVNLEHFRRACVEMKQEVIDSKELRRWLPTSRKRKYLGNCSVKSVLEGRNVWGWRFEA
jgi:hypothetical protein